MDNSLQIQQPEFSYATQNLNDLRNIGPDMANLFFDDVSLAEQDILFTEYQDLMKKESESYGDFTSFIDSKLDIEKLNKFNLAVNSGSLKRNEYSVFAIDFGGSSLKLSTVNIKYSNNNDSGLNRNILPEFSTLSEQRFLYSSENLAQIKQMEWNDWVADKILEYIEKYPILDNMKDSTGMAYASLTFSFPIDMKSIDSAFVVGYNKTFYFSEENLLSNDIVEALNNSLENRGIKLKINCVLNDVVASYTTALAFHYENPMAAIVGTGTNSGFLLDCSDKQVITNSEWARFKLDKIKIDSASLAVLNRNPGFLKLEALTAGIAFVDIIKEMARCYYNDEILADAIDLELIKYVFYSEESTNINVLKKVSHLSLQDLEKIYKLAYRFKNRAYQLLAPIIVAVSKGQDFTLLLNGTVACHDIDASMIKSSIEQFLKYKNINSKFELKPENSASLYGAAFVSIVYQDEI